MAEADVASLCVFFWPKAQIQLQPSLHALGATQEEMEHVCLHSKFNFISCEPEVFLPQIQEGCNVCNLASAADICKLQIQ